MRITNLTHEIMKDPKSKIVYVDAFGTVILRVKEHMQKTDFSLVKSNTYFNATARGKNENENATQSI